MVLFVIRRYLRFLTFAYAAFVVQSCRVSTTQSTESTVPVTRTVSDLREIYPTNLTIIKTSGYFSAGDGGENTFIFDKNSIAPDNGGSVIKPSSIISGPGRWISTDNPGTIRAKAWGIRADGVTDDAPRLQYLLDTLATVSGNRELILPAGKILIASDQAPSQWPAFFWAGSTSAFSLAQDGVLKISGAGKTATIVSTATPRTIFDGMAGNDPNALTLTLEGIGFEYTGGYREDSAVNAINTGDHIGSLTVHNCAFSNFTIAIFNSEPHDSYPGADLLEVLNSDFTYPHGEASVPQNPGCPGNVHDASFTGCWNYGNPRVAILEGANSIDIENCTFNGLVDDNFADAPGNAPTLFDVPMDGFFKSNGGGKNITIRGNSILNYHFEGILLDDFDFSGDFSNLIANNILVGGKISFTGFGDSFEAGIVSHRSVEILGNDISHNHSGINAAVNVDISNSFQEEIPDTTLIDSNTIEDSNEGLRIIGTHGAIVKNNKIVGQTQYPAQEINAGFANWRIGIHIYGGNTGTQVTGNIINGDSCDGWWDASSTINQTGDGSLTDLNRVYVEHPEQFTLNSWVELHKATLGANGDLSIAPVTGIYDTYITIDPGWAAAWAADGVNGFGNFAEVGDLLVEYSSKGEDPTRRGAIVNFNNQPGVSITDNMILNYDIGINYLTGINHTQNAMNMVDSKSVRFPFLY